MVEWIPPFQHSFTIYIFILGLAIIMELVSSPQMHREWGSFKVFKYSIPLGISSTLAFLI